MQAVAEQAAAEKEAYLARHTSFMENPISKSILDMKNAQNMTDLAERQANAAIAAQVAIDEAAAKAAIEEAIAAEQAAASAADQSLGERKGGFSSQATPLHCY